MQCPVCAKPLVEAGRTMKCETCEGAWIREEVLVAILEQRAATLVELPWKQREDKPRPCGRCGTVMQTVNLGSVALDRCAQHGVWFDANELAGLLREAKRFKTHQGVHADGDEKEQHREGLLRRLANLFS